MDKPLVYGAEWCGFCHRLRDWLKEHDVDFDYKDVDVDGGREEMLSRTGGNQTIPVLFVGNQFWVKPDGDILGKLFIDKQSVIGQKDQASGAVQDSLTKEEEVADKQKPIDDKIWDALLIGAGPASLAAAVYTSREDIETLLIEKAVIGGLAAITDMVDNYPGFPEGIEGLKLAENLEAQVKRFGATIELDEVKAIKKAGELFEVELYGKIVRAKSILIGTGSEWKKLGIPGEDTFYGKGVHNCATCDGAFYRDKRLVCVGGGNSSAQEALFLTKFASHIDILIRGDKWRASDVLIQEINSHDKITVHFNTTTDEIVGEDNKVVAVLGTQNGQQKRFDTDGVFVFIGLRPVTYYLEGSGVELDEAGFVKTNPKLQTNVPGIFCAGDVRGGATMQIASAVGEGAAAALSIREYLQERK